jgi:putative transposase
MVHSAPGRPQGRGKIERFNRTVRDQFLVEINTTVTDVGSNCTSLAELNRLFTAWVHQQYHRSRHSETEATPAERYHAKRSAPTRRPDPAVLRRAFLWREQRKVTSFATVSLHGNGYQVEPALVGRVVDLLFTPFDLTIIEVEYQGRPMGRAIPHKVSRHVHPAVKPDAPTPIQATGIDYLRLLEADHQQQAGRAINFTALQDPTEPQDGPEQT